MGISDISGRLASILTTTPRLTTLESVLQASLSLTHAPVSSRMPRVDKLGEASVARQAVDSQNQPVLKDPHEAAQPALRPAEPVLTHLSKTAGFLSTLMPQQDKGSPARATIPASQPVLDEPPHYPAPLAIALQATLQDSGLFYESHLLNWYQGQYPKDRLLKEPQSQLAGESEVNPPSGSIHNDRGGETPLPERLQREQPQTQQLSRTESEPASTNSLKEQAGLNAPTSEAAKLITQQLLLLDKPSLAWSVNVWPGQTATLLIEEESARTAETQAAWNSTIQLDFPKLGHMEISLKMDANGLRVHLDAENEKAFSSLMQQRTHCAEKLASTGCKLREFSIGSNHAST